MLEKLLKQHKTIDNFSSFRKILDWNNPKFTWTADDSLT